MPLRLVTLGVPLELFGLDGRACKFSNTKHLALLAYLALEPGSHAREWLTRFIWNSGEAGSMNDAVSALRAVFGREVFPPRTKDVNFDPSLVEVDARDLVTIAASDEENAYEEMLRLYRGPFLEDFNPKGASSRFISWVERKRAEYERTFLDASRRELQKAVAAGDWQMVRRSVEEILKRVSDWPEAPQWLAAAEVLQEKERVVIEPQLPVQITPAAAPPTSPHTVPVRSSAEVVPVAARPRLRSWRVVLLLIVAAVLAGALLLRRGEPVRVVTPTESATGTSSRRTSLPCEAGAAKAELIEEVFHYGVRVRAGRPFVKRWTLQNTGDCTWDVQFRLHRVSTDKPRLSATMMDAPLHRPIAPGDTLMFVVPMQAPAEPGAYGEVWELRDRGNQPVAIGTERTLVAMIRVPLPHYPPCKPGEGAAALLEKKYSDGTVVRAGELIRWSWILRNNGECAWGENALLRYISDSNGRMSRVDEIAATRSVEPGETYTFLVPMRVPGRPGAYVEIWSLRAGAGHGIPVDGLSVVNAQLRVQGADVPVTAPELCSPGQAQLRFVDENWPDSSKVRPGQVFTKRWTVVNRGTCAWTAEYVLRHVSNTGGQLARSLAPKPIRELVPPSATYTFEVAMRAPSKPGFYREDWEFIDDSGNRVMIGTVPFLAALIVVAEQ
jgi:DNA-binding SARP family transcriptional activator